MSVAPFALVHSSRVCVCVCVCVCVRACVCVCGFPRHGFLKAQGNVSFSRAKFQGIEFFDAFHDDGNIIMFELCSEPRVGHFEIHGANFCTRAHDVVFGITVEFEAFLFACGSEKDRNFKIALLYFELQFEIQGIVFLCFS